MNSKHKSWTAEELSYLYHPIMWGYSNHEVKEIVSDMLSNRTEGGIHGQLSDVRKWCSKNLGYLVANYEISPTMESLYKKASKILPTPNLLTYKPANPKRFIKCVLKNKKVTSNLSEQLKPNIPEQIDNNSNQILPAIESKLSPIVSQNEEPNILDVMKLAKELGALEVEYKGMKIKY